MEMMKLDILHLGKYKYSLVHWFTLQNLVTRW